ncbi:MAG: hypothetical protein JO331_13455 [Verrucomicrobia bacterium]|nr:hypothetical protein [Verrucomicrobiota bacterium]
MENVNDPDKPTRDDTAAEAEEENIEETLEDSFPASDPPSYAGGLDRKRELDSE